MRTKQRREKPWRRRIPGWRLAVPACLVGGVATAATLYVSPMGAHEEPFADWAAAATNILPALLVAVAGDTVWVTNGTYGLTEELGVPDGVTLRSVNGADWTTVDGNSTNRCLHLKGNQALAQGFTLRNGGADFGAGARFGVGGILRDCVVTQNVATNAGGAGVYVRWNGLVENCRIVGNRATAGQGGGICFLSGGIMRNCEVSGNTARVGGGVGLMFHATMVNCLVVSNTALQGGGVICSQNSTVLNSTIAHNIAASAGGLHGFYGGTVRNSIIYDNHASRGPNYTTFASPDNETRFLYTCALPLPPGVGNLEEDPAWVNAALGDLRLSPASPCLDAGNNEGAPADDLAGVERPRDGDNDGDAVVDMGAYEYAP